MREAVSSRRRGSMASEKCGMRTRPLSSRTKRSRAGPRGPKPERTGQNRRANRWGTLRGYPLGKTRLLRYRRRPLSPDSPSLVTGSFHDVIVRRAPAGLPFRPGALPARPWRASTPAARGQKPPGHHHPHHQNGHQYQNLPHGKRLLAYGCRSRRSVPAHLRRFRIPTPAPSGRQQHENVVVAAWHPASNRPFPRSHPRDNTPYQRAINTKGPPLRVSLCEKAETVAARKGLFTLRRFRSPARKTSLFAKGAYSSVRDRSKRRRLTQPEGERTQCE